MFNLFYHWLLRRVGLHTTITALLRRWQHAEPLVWLLMVGGAGIGLGWSRNLDGLLWAGAGLLLGVLLGHLFWGGNNHA